MILNWPDLFKIVCKIDINAFERLLTHHPNRAFIDSVLVRLHEGFWPFADTMKEGYPKLWDGLWCPPKSEQECDFLEEQVWTEIAAEHFSESFGMELLLRMYSPLVHAIPKPDSDTMCLVMDHSSGDFSPNSMITWEDVVGVWLNGLHTLGVSIMWSKHNCPNADLILYKSDVSTTYRQLLMHPLYQILQIVTVGSQRYIDRSNNFGGHASQIIWQSFMSLLIWILAFMCSIGTLKCYINDAFLVARAEDICWYEPYHQAILTDQAKILCLWDKIHLLHTEKKQVTGRAVTILGFEVDTNMMSVYLSMERQEQLVHSILNFTCRSLRMLQDWLRLAGQLNWALNVYPWLRPGLGGIYAKTMGKAQMWGRIKINRTVQQELVWFIEHVQQSSGLFFFKSMVWQEGDVGHSTLTIYVDVSVWGLGIWFLSEKKGYQCPPPILHLTDAIFFSKALVVCSAVHISECFPGMMHLLIATDNTNTFDIFMSLSAQPAYNPILISAVNILLHCDIDLRVIYIPGPLNHITDALLWYQNDLVRKLVPAIQIKNFTPSQDALGAAKKWYWYPHCWGNLPGLLGC